MLLQWDKSPDSTMAALARDSKRLDHTRLVSQPLIFLRCYVPLPTLAIRRQPAYYDVYGRIAGTVRYATRSDGKGYSGARPRPRPSVWSPSISARINFGAYGCNLECN